MEQQSNLHDCLQNVARNTAEIENMALTVNDHERRIRDIEGKGGKRWEALVTQIISLIAAAVAGMLIGKLV